MLTIKPLGRSYEVQVEEAARGSGAGGELMGILAELGKAFHLDKVMLTVFKGERAPGPSLFADPVRPFATRQVTF